MKTNYEACLAETLKHEGGWADHPSDPGGATMKGVTLATYRKYYPNATKADLRKINDADLRRIYRTYWDAVKGDELPPGLDMVAFDGAVNSGPIRGAQWVQHAVDVMPDGKIGPKTLEKAWQLMDPPAAGPIDRAITARLNFLKSLKTWPNFGKGWQARVDAVRAKAITMARAPVATHWGIPEIPAKPSFIARLIAWLFKGRKA